MHTFVYLYIFVYVCRFHIDLFLASQDALEVMRVTDWLTDWLTHWVDVLIDFTDVTLASEDTYHRLPWCDRDDPDDHEEPKVYFLKVYLASQDALEVMRVTHSLTYLLTE